MHFVTNLQYYIMFEVIEVGWAKLEKRLTQAADLDDLIAAHDANLDSILDHSFLGQGSSLVQEHLSQIFDLVLRFRGFADRIFEAACESSTHRKLALMQAEVRTAAGQWGSTAEDAFDGALDMRFVEDAKSGLNEIRGNYASLVEGLVDKLSDEVIFLENGIICTENCCACVYICVFMLRLAIIEEIFPDLMMFDYCYCTKPADVKFLLFRLHGLHASGSRTANSPITK